MHIAIIMDGNGRWASSRGLPRAAGHRAGARAVRRTVEAAVRAGIEVLSLYAFSAANWTRPAAEVRHLMHLLERYLLREAARCVQNGVRIAVIGRRDRLDAGLLRAIDWAESTSRDANKLSLRLAVDYSGRVAIARAAHESGGESREPACFEPRLAAASHAREPVLPVDLLIRTGGEQRLSDFLLWECAYAELLFVDTYWPDFDEHDFAAALRDFESRERRYGGLPELKFRHAQ